MAIRLIYPPLPEEANDDTILRRFEKAGYHLTRHKMDTVIRQMQMLIGEDDYMLRASTILRLFSDAQMRKGRALTMAEMRGIAQPSENADQFYHHIQRLVVRGILMKGVRVRCPFCEVEGWYRMQSAEFNCPECGAILQPTQDLETAYKPNMVFMKGVKNGALTILVLLNRLHNVTEWGANYVLNHRGTTIELDLVLISEGRLMIVECKDSIHNVDKLRRQLQDNAAIAHGVRADVLMFATLETVVPQAIADILAQAGVPAMVLNRHRLIRNTWTFSIG